MLEFMNKKVEERMDVVELYDESTGENANVNNGVCGDVNVNVGACG